MNGNMADLLQKADAGDSGSCWAAGQLLADSGRPDEAIEYYQKGVDSDNDPYCLCSLGEAYEAGDGTERNIEKADYYFGRAIAILELRKYDERAAFNLGVAYFKSEKHRNYKKAYDCFKYCYYNCGNPLAHSLMEMADRLKRGKKPKAVVSFEEKTVKKERNLFVSGLMLTLISLPFLFYVIINLWTAVFDKNTGFWDFIWLIRSGWNTGYWWWIPLAIAIAGFVQTLYFIGCKSGGAQLVIARLSAIATGLALLHFVIAAFVGVVALAIAIIAIYVIFCFMSGEQIKLPSFKPGGVKYEKTYNTTATRDRGKLVQEGMHRYIETGSGQRITVSDYDQTSGVAKGSDGKIYKIEGSITEREIKHK